MATRIEELPATRTTATPTRSFTLVFVLPPGRSPSFVRALSRSGTGAAGVTREGDLVLVEFVRGDASLARAVAEALLRVAMACPDAPLAEVRLEPEWEG